jgi:DNA-binding transcriptional LysR family regulator
MWIFSDVHRYDRWMLDVTRLRVLEALARHGSVTATAKELNYTQPTVSHHLARLEAETGAQLLQRAGRRVRLTPAGELLAERAAEILGRLEGADAELAAHVGLSAGRVRMASFSSPIGSLVPQAVAALTAKHPGVRVSVTNTHPLDALDLLRTGRIDIALIFRYGDTAPEPDDIRLHHLLDDPLYLLSTRPAQSLGSCRDATWIGGCERCRTHLLSICSEAGFEPKIDYVTDDLIVMQSLVAAGLGVTTLPGLALRAHHVEGVEATEIPGSHQRIYAATYGDPPDPPATTALLAALTEAAASIGQIRRG